jgi:ribonuclease D
MMTDSAAPPFIDSDAALAPWLARWADAPWLALDTEFIREDTYYPKLCVVQVGDGRDSVCIDALARMDLDPLFTLLARPTLLKVFHAGGQDLEIFVHRTGACPAPLFDTQVAAALLGYGDQIGYSGLVEKLGGGKIDKTLSRTDWTRRPLSGPQLAYAADDVRWLAAFYPRIESELRERGRLTWLQEDCDRLTDASRYRPSPETEWERLKGLARLPAPAQHVAAALAAWRETIAEQRNRPRNWILSDDALYRIAERRPQSRAQLEGLGVLPPKTLDRHAEALLSVVAQHGATGEPPLAVEERPNEAMKARSKRLSEALKAIATELNVPPSLLATRSDLEALMADGGQARISLLTGWRRAVAGERLLALAVA